MQRRALQHFENKFHCTILFTWIQKPCNAKQFCNMLALWALPASIWLTVGRRLKHLVPGNVGTRFAKRFGYYSCLKSIVHIVVHAEHFYAESDCVILSMENMFGNGLKKSYGFLCLPIFRIQNLKMNLIHVKCIENIFARGNHLFNQLSCRNRWIPGVFQAARR